MENDLYEVLGVPPTADDKQLRAAYRRQAKLHHPDVGGNPEQFRSIQQAYERLSSPEGRALYDAERAAPPRSASDPPRPAGPASPPPYAGRTGPTVDDRIAQARAMRSQLALLLEQLQVADEVLYTMYQDWTRPLAPADRARLRSAHDELADRTAELLAQARHLSEVLGVVSEQWPPMPTIESVFSPPDEMGYDVPVRVWFTEPSDLLTGPLWFTPRLSLRARTAGWAGMTVTAYWVSTKVLTPQLGNTPGASIADIVTRNVTYPIALVAAMLAGALLWPLLLAQGSIRRSLRPVGNRIVRWALGAGALGALSAGPWWWPSWPAAVLWTLGFAALGALLAMGRAPLARWWVTAWTSTVAVAAKAYLKRRRAGRGPRRTSRRTRRRARRAGM